MPPRLLYLHGFASGPTSRKARFFAERLRAAGRKLETPDLAAGDFEHLTITGQLSVVENLLQGDPAILIGSSLGGYLAALYASRHPEVERLVLLAPAFHFGHTWTQIVGKEALENWRATDRLPVFHYGEQRQRYLHYGIVEESQQWESEPSFAQPGHIFHGSQDSVVPVSNSERYAACNPNVRLTTLESDHALGDALPAIWELSHLEILQDTSSSA